jgi:aerobic-type carbon monoxide dehydrogenase small subunit (CoxS/CutS family)
MAPLNARMAGHVDITLNGQDRTVDFAAGTSLLQLLRNELGLRSMKDGCAPEGSCGACTVIVDGRPVVSCAQPAERFEGKDIETLEGLPEDTRDLWADAFSATGASQCGYCTPGIVMKAEALLRREAEPATSAAAPATSPSSTPSARWRQRVTAAPVRCRIPAQPSATRHRSTARASRCWACRSTWLITSSRACSTALSASATTRARW